MPTLAVLDGHNLAYRAFYALPDDLATSAGQVTNSAYGFTSMLIKLLGDHHPDALVVTWDTPKPTFRNEEYPDYKAQRDKAPDTLSSQLPLIREIVATLGMSQFEMPGFEADDIIATVAEQAKSDGWEVLIVSGDRDTFQLIDDHCRVLYLRRGISDLVVADEAWVEGRYGIRADQYPDYAALRGDSSDNLPGVPGVGEKTATRLISGYGNLEGLYDHLDEQTPKLAQNLAANRGQAFLNRRLMRLIRDLSLDVRTDSLRWEGFDRAAAKNIFDSMEFHSLWDRLLALGSAADEPAGAVLEVDTGVITDRKEIEKLARLDPLVLEPVWDQGDVTGVVIAQDRDRAGFVPVDHLDGLASALGDGKHPKVMHDAKDFIRYLLDAGIAFDGLATDTALAAYLLNPAARNYDLEELAGRYLNVELESPDREKGAGSQGMLDFGGGPDLDAAGRRAVTIGQLAERLREELADRDELALLDDIEMPLVLVLARMEAAGIGIDGDYLEELGESLRDQLADLEGRIHVAAGQPFNINSTGQLREILFDQLGLPVLKKTPKGAPSTDASVLEKLADAHPIVSDLLEYRELEKLRSTYVDGYLPLVTKDGRIHTRFNQLAATTGRLSSDRPNLQNIPVRSERGKTIRRAFVPRPGWRFVIADYSQIELRILAHLSQDPGLLAAFRGTETDIHTETAARVFGLQREHVTHEMRRRAKAINFGLLYGMEAFGLADRLQISRDEATEHIDAYFEQFPLVREFLQSVVTEARNRGYTQTIFGRRRYLPELSSDNFRIRQMGERMALNAPVQGSAADIIKKAMVDLDKGLQEAGLATTLLLQIHDELILEAPEHELAAAETLTRNLMESVTKLEVPLRVDLSTGTNLAEAKG
ncbi:MAG: DNA polymerase I [Acidimicrobiia bacterium]|nr:DNA polymerase I [Acidimicrobiia bacterium]MDH3396253.1 DNA polymerase I [Acidimicrobiia bacterium]